MKQLSQIADFFPVRLLIVHFKHNLILLIFWGLLLAIITEKVGSSFGIPYLFLDPEYLGAVSFKSLFVIGLFLGVFALSFQATSYIMNSYKFPFLSTLKHPFLTYVFNNSLIPMLFLACYAYALYQFQEFSESSDTSRIKLISGLMSGYLVTVILSLLYFGSANKNRFFVTENLDKKIEKSPIGRQKKLSNIRSSRYGKFTVLHFFDITWRIKKARNPKKHVKHKSVFDQNHINALFFELFIFLLVLTINYFDQIDLFKIPAGASILIFLTFIIMMTGALFYWMKKWALTMLIAGLIILNIAYSNGFLNREFRAVGLDYSDPVEYSLSSIKQHTKQSDYYNDKEYGIKILENWRKNQPNTKPKMVLVCTSGGGIRSALWTYISLQEIDRETNGAFFKSTTLISGASGGMIGAAYYRELHLRNEGVPYDLRYADNIAKDLLNPIALKLMVNDPLPFSKSYTLQGKIVKADRGTAFEVELNHVTDGVMDKKIIDYRDPEYNAKIPMIILSPTILNDGRKLYISSQPIAYMSSQDAEDSPNMAEEVQAVEFRKLFKHHNADSLSFLTALRMNASFPYINPSVELPSMPPISVTDAGMTDNYGVVNAIKFLHTFKDWINENTSGVIIVSIRDHAKETPLMKYERPGLFKKLIDPIGGFYNNWSQFQDFNQDNLINFADTWLDNRLDVLYLEYLTTEENEKNKASLSWHLTEKEKGNIKDAIFTSTNQTKITELKKLLNVE